MQIDLRRLRLFVEVIRQGGFSRAARVVFATQPTVSKAVKQLEGELGVPLLERAGRRSELTAAGRIVYRRAVGLLAEGEDLIAELDELRGLKRGTLRLGFPRLGTSSLFAPMFASFRRRYPGVEVELDVHDSKRLEEILRAGGLDFAALVHPIPEDLDHQEVSCDPLVVLLPRDHPFARRKALKLERLAALPFILFEEGFPLNERIVDACRKVGRTPSIAARSSQVDFIFELVSAGAGVAFLPRVLAEQRPHRRVRRVPLDEPECDWRIALAWRRGGYLSHAARAWLEHAQRAFIRGRRGGAAQDRGSVSRPKEDR
jgi:DNA-binding transcriptional LysR family regulator